ncbi:MAG TPA: hypothetical protein VF974_04930 [Patescibacteria group bacterium]
MESERVICHWCAMEIKDVVVIKDHLKLHGRPILAQVKSCLELYTNYCRYLKELPE